MQTFLAKRKGILNWSSPGEVLAVSGRDYIRCPCQRGLIAVPDTLLQTFSLQKAPRTFCFSASCGADSLCPGTERTDLFQQTTTRICILLDLCI